MIKLLWFSITACVVLLLEDHSILARNAVYVLSVVKRCLRRESLLGLQCKEGQSGRVKDGDQREIQQFCVI